jgi:ATP-dependent DNA helicase RecG
VGEFLKELEMTEGRGTGTPKMLREIEKNGSPEPIFRTDNDRTFFPVEFSVHPVFAETMKKEDVTEVTEEVKRLPNVMTGDHSRKELQALLSPRSRAGEIKKESGKQFHFPFMLGDL